MGTCLEPFQSIAAITTTPRGIHTLAPLWQSGTATLWIPEPIDPSIQPSVSSRSSATLQSSIQNSQHIRTYSGALKAHLATLWPTQRSLVFCLSTGAVVRLIAPLLQDKATDPAVVVVDEGGKFVISLCSGHQGGADALARTIARHLGATAILTGGANGLDLPGVDLLGLPFGWNRGTGDWTALSAAVARQEPIQVIQEAGSTLWQAHLPAGHSFVFEGVDSPPSLLSSPSPSPAHLWISPIQRRFDPASEFPQVQWHPRVLWVGIGCERGTPRQLIEKAIQTVCQTNHLAEAAIAGIATLDLKADELGLVELCLDRQWPLQCFPAEALRAVSVPNPSSVVAAEVGTPSVAEAAATLASLKATYPHHPHALLSSPPALRVAKTIFRHPDYKGAVTVAIAEAEREYTGRSGQLWLVGIGPGELTQITPAAQAAIVQSDVVIGYSLYVDLVASLLRPGQIVEALPITQERQRAERAIELAQWGLTVAVISSGDCGIYGMAGLVLEQLQIQGWDGKTPNVQVFPGISALQAAASRVGAPLMHDFCAISLSDLLTPWNVIEQRLTAAAQADFVTALYNPRSQTRIQQITMAQQIFLNYRDPNTPVAIVRSAYRPDEQITLTTLVECLNPAIDMLTTIIIGNRSTRFHANWMITPRGYLAKEGRRTEEG
jgi:cobalt-precorrin 5A hydrolase/precorrin-3B C17-methyltransferase